MENTPDKDDEQWLSALAGRADPSGDAKTNFQAQALRRALLERAEKLEVKVPFADDDQYQKLLLRLQREKLLAAKSGWRNSAAWVKTTGALGLSADVIPWKSPMILGLTATLVIGIAAVINIQNSAAEKSDVELLRLRGSNATTQIVEEPEVRLAELVQGLRTVGEDPVIERIRNGSIILTLNASPKVLEYLETPPNRISPSVVDGKVTLLLTRPKSTPKPN
jgi:hypothetical protein